MLRDENYLHQQRQFRSFEYGPDEYDETTWYWNMNHQANGNAINQSKKLQQKSKNAYYPSNRSHTSSGFQSFFRWFKKDEKSRGAISDISYPREVTSSTDTLELDSEKRFQRNSKARRRVKASRNNAISPPSSPRFSRAFSQSSSCDSVFSTASSFAFVPPIKYLTNRNQKQPAPNTKDRACSESIHRKPKANYQGRDFDKKNEIALRRKYQLYAESSDAETNYNNTPSAYDNSDRRYQDFSLPTARKINLPDSAKLHDLSVTKHRRTSSDSSKDKKAGAYVHVKGKRKAPPPPEIRINPRTLSPKSSLGRKKRPAPKPPIAREVEAAAASSTSLLEDKEIKALIEGTSRTFTQRFEPTSTSSIPIDMERKAYVSPYLKIREDRKLTDEQKRILIEQVTKNTRKTSEPSTSTDSPQATKRSTPDIFTIERGQLVYQGNESPKLSHKDEKKLIAPSSPISPRPWFKRQSASSQKDSNTILKSLEKKKHKNEEKDLPELGYSRNSFFGNASRFNIFARIGDDSKKRERDAEKRKSQIGIPNISELDREAAEIIQRGHEIKSSKQLNASELLMLRSQINNLKDRANEDEDRPRSAKDLINKFEADTSHVNRITLNPAYLGRREFFGESFSSETNHDEKSNEVNKNVELKEAKESTQTKSKLPQLVKDTNGIRQQNDLMGLWTCPYCTLENPNWRIICGACEKIKPYEKRFLANGDLKSKASPTKALPKESDDSENLWDKKTEAILKYFQPPSPKTSHALSKSASETTVVKSLKRKSPTPSQTPSPQLNLRRNPLFKASSENQESLTDVIEEEATEKIKEDTVIVKTTPSIYSEPKEVKTEVNVRKLKSPNLDEIRSARLAKFNMLSNFKRNQVEDENSFALNTNRKQSPEKKFPDKLDFSDPIALELEKERLREKIRAMNAKALTERYPLLKRVPENKVLPSELSAQPTPLPNAEASKLGAIRKTFKNPFEARRGSFEKEKGDEKILNQDAIEKTEKVSISVQTKVEDKREPKLRDSAFLPTTVSELSKDEKRNDETAAVKVGSELTTKQQEEVEVISDQLKSRIGIETFKATLRSKSINKTNTLAINKILRNLENAICEGKYDDAAQLATDLAKMKVSLSVTRHKDRPKSDIDLDSNVKVNLTVKDGVKNISSVLLEFSRLMTLNDLKRTIESDFKIPASQQTIWINNKIIEGGEKVLENFRFGEHVINVNVQVKTLDKANLLPQNDSESDDETQNEKVGNVEGAVGGDINNNSTLKIEEDGWECPLCTLINMPNMKGCLACSTSRPVSYKVPSRFQEIEYKLKVNEDLRTFFEMDKVEVRPQSQKNDLNRKSVNRKSSEIFNILVEEKPQVTVESTSESAPTSQVISSPNITKNKYRGVENFNPSTNFNPSAAFVFPKLLDVRKPIITSVVYKTKLSNTKESIKVNQNHYQELVSLDLSDIAHNLEKFECTICFMEIQPRAGAVLRECLHSFCKDCLASHIMYSEEPEIKCPFIDDQFSCQSLLQEREIRSLVSREEYEKHLGRSIRQAENKIENTFHCKTPNCRGWCIFEDTSNIFRCPVCTMVNCLTCGAVHDGINCKQYQDQLNNDKDSESAQQTKQLLQDLIDKEEALNCPTCHIFLLKKWGCDWLKCSFCKTEICWVTRGPRWGPNGKGDTSSGCKCGVAGKKCSPKCNYCH